MILALHGGGFISGSVCTHRKVYAHLAKATGARALITDYRKVPEHRHPAPLDDATTAYRLLLDQGVEPRESNRDKDPFFKQEVVAALAASFLGDTDAHPSRRGRRTRGGERYARRGRAAGGHRREGRTLPGATA